MKSSHLDFPNGFSIEIDRQDGRFNGLGRILFNGIPLRSSRLPWTLYTESETDDAAVRFESFILADTRHDAAGGAITLVLKSTGRWMPRAQQADAMGEARIKTRRLKAPEAVFHWKFRPVTERLFENEWQGLAMQVSYECADAPIHWLMEAATWEIGGEAAGCTLIQQDVSAIQLEQAVTADGAFSTIEKFFTNGWGGSYPMDMLPRAAGAAICDFQSKGNLALCLFAEKPGLTRARLDKHADENIIHYLDRAYFPLGAKVRAPERKLLVFRSPRPLKRHESRNLWLDCFTGARRRILDHYGFKLEIPEPCSGGHLWDKDLKSRMSAWAGPLERDLPLYSELGYKQAFIHGVWDSVTSDPSPPSPGNICCPYKFEFAGMFGGAERMRRLNAAADRHGVRLMQWFSFHLSRHAPVWTEHPDWVLREANGDPWDGKYQNLWSGRMRGDYRKWFLDQVVAVNTDTGIAGIFWDSYQNLGVTGIDWGAPDKAPQADEIFHLQAGLQRMGFKQRVEVVTIFGVSQVAIFGFENDKFRRRLWDDFVGGDHAFALLDTSPAFFSEGESPLGPGRLSPGRYFWMVAHRSVPGISADPWELQNGKTRRPGGEAAEAYARVNHLYNRLVPRMARLRLQEGGSHVVWNDAAGKPAVVWVFRDTPAPAGARLVNAETGETVPGGGLLAAGSVYTFGNETAENK
jgi:hypothetical protein